MTELSSTIIELRELEAEIARVDDLIAQHPQYESLSVDRASLVKRQSNLESVFDRLTDAQLIDVCRYSFVPDRSDRYPLLSLTKILTEFQELVTTAFDAVKTGKPKVRARASAELQQQSSFDFGYVAAGSLRVALMIPNDRLLTIESDLDRAVDLVFQTMQAQQSNQIAELSSVIGIASIKKLYELAEEHVSYGLSAAIEWRRKGEVRKAVIVQPPEFERLCERIRERSEETIEPLRLVGRLVGLDVELGTFHMTFPEAEDISGRLAAGFSGGKPSEVPGHYKAELLKKTVIYYSTRQDKVTYELTELLRD